MPSSSMMNNFDLSRFIYEQQTKGAKRRKIKNAVRDLPQHHRRRNLLNLRFNALKRKWKSDAEILSSPTEMAMLDSYQQIIGMGPQVVPLIMRELSREPDFWFWALRAITGSDPVPEESQGDLDAMAEHWLSWYSTRRGRVW